MTTLKDKIDNLVKEIAKLKATHRRLKQTCDNHHKTSNVDLIIKTADAGNSKQCHQCNDKFHTKETLQDYMKKKHNKEAKVQEHNILEINCDCTSCTEMFQTYYLLNKQNA